MHNESTNGLSKRIVSARREPRRREGQNMIPSRDYGSSCLTEDGIAGSSAPLREPRHEDVDRNLGPRLYPEQRL